MKFVLFIVLIAVGLASSQPDSVPRCPVAGQHILAHPGFCDRYIRCIHGHQFFERCDTGRVFDTVLGVCNTADDANASCRLQAQCTLLNAFRQINPDTMPSCPITGQHSFGIPGVCDQFIRCTFGHQTYVQCTNGFVFDIVLGDCNTVDGANASCTLQAQCSLINSFRPNNNLAFPQIDKTMSSDTSKDTSVL